MPSTPHVRPLLLALVLPLVAVLAGCGLNGTNDGGYITGDGRVISYAADDRGDPVKLSGPLLGGGAFDPSSLAGKVTVVNTWGAWCGECVKEADYLQQAHEKLGDDVAFLGLDIRDPDPANPQAFERQHAITYPSIYTPDGKTLLSLPRDKTPGSIPFTMVLDTEGRVAAVFRGAVPSTLTLTETVQCVQDPSGQGC